MSSLHITILFTLLTILIADNQTFYFTKSSYDLWCQENILSNSLFLYSNQQPIGIYRTSNIKSISYYLLNDENNGLFQLKTRRLADFYFLIVNLTRPLDINREYQDVYKLRIQANILTTKENLTEQTELRIHVADSNDNDGVFDMDIYEENFTQPIDISRPLLRIHASDADQIQHAQIFYELPSTLNETFSLHPFTGDLYLINQENLQQTYEFDIYAYDRHRQRFVDNNMKSKTHMKLHFQKENQENFSFETIFNQTIEYRQMISSYDINITERKSIHLLNIHQPILTIDIQPSDIFYRIYFLKNSSSNTRNLFLDQNHIYLNDYLFEEYHLQLMICFENNRQCQYTNYRYIPLLDFNAYEFHFKSIENLTLDENLPVDSYLTRIEIEYKHIDSDQSLIINYKLLNDEQHLEFYIHPKTGILRLAERLEYRLYTLDIQANIQLFNRRYSIETMIAISVREINKHEPKFHPNTATEFFQLPYQFQAIDYDQNRETNGRVSYRLLNCSNHCPFVIDPNNGTLVVRSSPKEIYDLQILAFDWGEPISLESHLNIRVDLRRTLSKRDSFRTRSYSRRWRKKTTTANLLTTTISTQTNFQTTTSFSNTDTVYLNVGFRENLSRYHLAEDASINRIIDRLKLEYDLFPLIINDETDNLFFYTLNDTNLPFIIDQNDRTIKLIDKLDREKQNRYVFEIELKLKSIYSIKLKEIYSCVKTNSSMNFQYTTNYYSKMIVIIDIDDVNDNIPKCRIFHKKIHLNENHIEKNLYRVQAYDPDLGENGTLIYSLFNYQEYFSIDSSTGIIDCIKPIDREEYSYLQLHILVSDQGIQPQYQTICTTLHIIINDFNDNIPQFSLNTYQYYLFADTPRYSIFGQIHADDADENNQLIYTLSPNPYLTIHQYTGHLRLKHYLYRLSDQILNVTVQVYDGLHRNQTTIQIFIQTFADAQQPILLSEPAYGLTINQSLPLNSVLTNIYRRFQLSSSTIDFIEIINDQMKLPFSIDQQGHLRLTKSLIGLSKSTYWLALRLTRYRASPAQTYFHIHLTIRQENFYLPQCLDLYQTVQVYDYSLQYPFAHIEAQTLNKNSLIQYSLENNEKIFSINKQTGYLHLLPIIHSQRQLKNDYLLTIRATDIQYKMSSNCYLKVHLIRRRQLLPKFLSSNLEIDLPEISLHSGRLRQRLFQVIALLNPDVYNKKLEIRYRFPDNNQHFIINRQTGYLAAKQPLIPYTTYEFQIEAFTIAYHEEILSDGNENEEEDQQQSSRSRKWRIVSSRVTLPMKLRILPLISLTKSLLSPIDSTINIDLLTTTKVGSNIFQLGLNQPLNQTQWFIMVGDILHTRYFHVDFQTGQLILIRPILELINQTNLIELRINVTSDWIHMNIIKIFIRLINNQISPIKFSQTDYYSSVSKSIPIGAEIARITIENPSDDCIYTIDTVERVKSKDLFQINSYTGSVTVLQTLENALNERHLLKILYRCESNYYMTSTNLHINILDEKNSLNQTKNFFRFTQDIYLIIFQSSLVQNQEKKLIDLELINDQGEKIKPQAKLLQGDPFDLFSIDSSTQTLRLLDESRVRSYQYPLDLTIIDLSQNQLINTTVRLFISNIGIFFPCPNYLTNSPFLFTYQSLPLTSIDLLTGQNYHQYKTLIIRAFDPFTPLNGEASNQAECIINSANSLRINSEMRNLNFIFSNDIFQGFINQSFDYSSYIYNSNLQPLQIHLSHTHFIDLTYHFVNQTYENLFHLDEYAGLIQSKFSNQFLSYQYSFLIYAKYQSFITFTRLNLLINNRQSIDEQIPLRSIYEFKFYIPFVNNMTIGYLNTTKRHFTILNEQILPMIAIDHFLGRIFIRNRTLLLTNGNFYDFLIQDEDLQISRIQIIILPALEPIYECEIQYLNNQDLIGFIQIRNDEQLNSTCHREQTHEFDLLNYNDLFSLNREYGLLSFRKTYSKIHENLLLLIQIDQSKCLITLEKSQDEYIYRMIRNESDLYRTIQQHYGHMKSSGQLILANGTRMKYDLIPSQAPLFKRKSYEFTLNLTNKLNDQRIYLGRISGEGYDPIRSHLVYQFLTSTKDFRLDIDNGTIDYLPNEFNMNQTTKHLEILVRDLIYQENTTINLTIHLIKPTKLPISSLIYHQYLSQILPLDSIIFQPNLSLNQTLQYSFRNHSSNHFRINPSTGEVRLAKYLTKQFYSFQIHLSPIDQILVIKLIILPFNLHQPVFLNLPSNLSLSIANRFLTKLSAYDRDVSDNLKLKYYLLDSIDSKIFSLNESNGILTLNKSNNLLIKSFYQLNLGVSDGLYLTKTYLQIHLNNYSQTSPKFSSNEYVFSYDQTRDILGQISAIDEDLNDRILYELYQQPDEISIDSFTGIIKISKTLFSKPILEFFASAKDLANQIVYTKIKLLYSIQPKFSSNLYFISINPTDINLPLAIFQFELVDFFNQSLSGGKFQIKNQTDLFEIKDNRLIFKENFFPLKSYFLNINAYWKNFILQTAIQIQLIEKTIELDKYSYDLTIDKSNLKNDFLIQKFSIEKNLSFKIISTPLTRNDCHENFYVKVNELFVRTSSILSDVCFFELHVTDKLSISSIQMKISFINSIFQPKFSSKNYQFNINNPENVYRVFAQSSNSIRYELESNSYGLIINQTDGILRFQMKFPLKKSFQLNVFAIDQINSLNDTAKVQFQIDENESFQIPTNLSQISFCPNKPIEQLSDQSLPGTVIQDIREQMNNISNFYYILNGDLYNLFAINHIGQLYLTSEILNQTNENYFHLIIGISSQSSLTYCQTNISIIRRPKWSYFICPPMPIEWKIEEESPIGTILGTVKDLVMLVNNSTELIDQITYKLSSENHDEQSFLLNSRTGLITSNSRLDYEQKYFYTFFIIIQPIELNCSIPIRIQLINIPDNSLSIDTNSLIYNLTENNPVPFYIGRIRLIDIDQLLTSNYEYFLRNFSSKIFLDQTTGSIVFYEQLDREIHGPKLEYSFDVIEKTNSEMKQTNQITIYLLDLNDNGPRFEQNFYSVNISKSLRINSLIYQLNASSMDPIANGLFHYSLLNSSEYFSLDELSGIIRLKNSLPSILTNFTLTIQVFEDNINLTDQTIVFLQMINDEHNYFDLNQQTNCFLNENQLIGTRICTIGKNIEEFIYQIKDPNEYFGIFQENGTIFSKRIFDYEIDSHQYNLTIIVKDRENQSAILSSLNLTIYLRNLNDYPSEFLLKNSTTLLYLYYPSINSIIHQIQAIDRDQTNLTFELMNTTSYKLNLLSNNTVELILIEPIVRDHDDDLIIRLWDSPKTSINLHLHLIYVQRDVQLPKLLSQTIDGYINLDDNISAIDFGPLFIQNQSQYQFVSLNLLSNQYFTLEQLSSNQTNLYFHPSTMSNVQQKNRLLQFQIELTAIAIQQTISQLNFSNNLIIYHSLHPSIHRIDIHLWSIDREMLDRSISLILNRNSQSTYEQFLIESLPIIREYLAEIIGVQLRHVHIYTFEQKSSSQIELLIAIIRHPSRLRPPRYIHKKLLYNALKNSSEIFSKILHVESIENIFISQCHSKSCENNGRCTSQIKLVNNQYEYFYSKNYQRLIPKYQWNIKCLCLNHYSGQYCQFKQNYQSPCSSNPCSALERCIEESSTLYTCQCIDEPCQYNENDLNCINMNSPTCRDASNTLTFDGYSFLRMKYMKNLTKHWNISFTFRTQVSQGKLLSLIDLSKQIIHQLQIENGYVHFQINQKEIFYIDESFIHDGLWHTIFFSIDYRIHTNQYYYLLRLDDVFSRKISLIDKKFSNHIQEFLIGNDFHGCLGNLTINNQIIYLQKQANSSMIEHIGTNDGCQLAEIETRTLRQYQAKDEICSIYHPCYYGGVCTSSSNGLSFTCQCVKPRFTGRQCQKDTQPCLSNPCLYDEQCITTMNSTYSCISSLKHLPMSTRNPFYIALAVTICTCILIFLLFLSLILYCQQQRKDKKRTIHINQEKPIVSAPLLMPTSPPKTTTTIIESPIQTLLKLNSNGKQTVETLALVDNNPPKMNNFNDKHNHNQLNKSSQSVDKQQYQSHESINRRSESKYYSTIGRMNIPPDNFLGNYNNSDYDTTRILLVDHQSTDLFDFPSSPTKYFNGHQDETSQQYQICINSLSNLTDKLAEQNEMELTHSSNDSSNNEQTLLTSPILNTERKRSLFNGGSSLSIRASNSSLSKAPVYAKIIKTSTKTTNGGMSTIERLRLSGSPLRLLSSSPTYTRATSFFKTTDPMQTSSSSSNKTNKINPTTWKLNPRKLDSLKARRNSQKTDDEGEENETTQLTINRLRHASESDLTNGNTNGKKLSSFFQTEV